ncbi:MAG TPA: molecular chaperone TorD family protein [Burkholderiaceae bacterium]|nr:molecular chaperone TorD family protein [Burkholderiaceae bacterium]
MSAGAAQPLSFSSSDAGEELARAELYGLLARLYLAAPDEPLLEQFRIAVTQAPEEGAFLERPWESLVAAMRETTAEAAAEEYDALFQGLGKPEVLLYGSYYLTGFLNERPLAVLRSDLARLGLVRDIAASETEDHVACVFEVMRYLIAGDDVEVCNLEQQRRFFRAHVQPWVEQMCETLAGHPAARLYRQVALFTQAFVQVETQAFDMIE